MSHTSPSVMLVDFSGSRSGLPRWMKVGATPRQFASMVAWGRPARLAQRALSSTTAPPKAAIELGLFSVDDGARNALAYVPRSAKLFSARHLAPNFGVSELPASV